MTAPRITLQSWLMVATLGITWGAAFMVIEIALEGLTPFWLAAGRVSFAALLMVVIWGARGFQLFGSRKPPWGPLIVIGAFSSAVPFMLLSWGLQYVTSGFAGVSMAAVALLVLPLSHFFIPGERMHLRRVIGFLTGFVGVVILIGGQAFESTGSNLEFWGRILCLCAAGCYAISSVMLRRLPPVDPIGVATVLLLVGMVIAIPVALIVEGPPSTPPTKSLIALIILGLIPTAGANSLRVLVVRSAGPVFMSLTNYQVPLWSVFFGAMVLGEPLPPSLLTAMVLILSGVALSQWGALKRLFAR